MSRGAVAVAVALALPAGAAATFPGGNGRIVYSSGLDGLWTARSDGSYRRALVRLPSARDAAWSADGRRVVFAARPSARSRRTELYSVRADGRRLRRVTRNRRYEQSPSWSPSGHRIAFVRMRLRGVNDELWVMHADGSSQRFLTRVSSVAEAEWSPDGDQIAYVAPDDNIALIDPDTGERARVTQEPEGALVGDLSWSPDGQWLAFSETRCGPCDDASLAKVRRDGTGQRKIEPGTRFELDSGAPNWSPDGRFISFCRRNDAGRASRWTMHPDGRTRRQVATIGCAGDWQPRVSR